MEFNDSLVTVFRSRTEPLVEVVRNALLAEGIPCTVHNEHQSGFAGILEVKLLVAKADAERARAVIDHHHAQGEDPVA